MIPLAAPRPPSDPLRVGDIVTWNGRHTGRLARIVGDGDAEVEESRLLGRRAVWRFSIATLRRADGRGIRSG